MSPVSRHLSCAFFFFLIGLLLCQTTEAQVETGEGKWRLSGQIEGVGRFYADGPENDYQSGLHIEPKWTWRNETEAVFTFRPRLSLEENDTGVKQGEIQEIHLRTRTGPGTIGVGISRLFWGVVESRHLIDIVNPPDYARHYTGDIRIGTAMFHLAIPIPFGQVEALLLPWEQDPRFPGINGRPRTLLPVSGAVGYPEGKPDAWVMRMSFSGLNLDTHLYYFRGLDREAVLVPVFNALGPPTALTASRFLISQWGLDFQTPIGNWLIKGEGLYRSGYSGSFVASVTGVEYILNSVGGSVHDLSVISEYQWDDNRPADAPLPLLTKGLFMGGRLAMNDPPGTEMKVGILWDIDSKAYLPRLTFFRRLGNLWTMETNFHVFANVARSPTLKNFADDSYLEVSFKYHI